MKLSALLLAFLVAGAFAQTVTNWDLSELSGSNTGVVEADKAPQAVLDRKAANQGLNGKISTQGKTSTLSLTVPKERSPRVTDVDRLLFGFEYQDVLTDNIVTNITLSYEETASIVQSVLGDNWETEVHLPTEDLSYIEVLRLAASLNEFTLITHNARGKARQAGSNFVCTCHGTAHQFEVEDHPDGVTKPEFKGNKYWGVRVLYPDGQGKGHWGPAHNNQPYVNTVDSVSRDCDLCWPSLVTADALNRPTDCRYCCYGRCVVDRTWTGGPSNNPTCQDQTWDGNDGNEFNLNAIGACAAPMDWDCESAAAAVDNICACTDYIPLIAADTDVVCGCDEFVGISDLHCVDCAEALDSIADPTVLVGCDCTAAFTHLYDQLTAVPGPIVVTNNVVTNNVVVASSQW